jgi:hypothetical protein
MQELGSGWLIADNVVAFLFACATTAFLVFLTWRISERLLSEFLGRRIAVFGGLFACILIGVSGIKVAADFLYRYKKQLPIIQGIISGMADTVNVCITPKLFSPLEFLIFVGVLLYFCYWLHTRFIAKQSIDEIRDKFEHTVDPDMPPKAPFQY